MEVGEVRIAEDSDFKRLIHMCSVHDDWRQDYDKASTTVWTKSTPETMFKLIKVRSIFKDLSAALVYDVLHDPEYRKEWDTNMIEGTEICCINPNNDIGYYALKTPKPLKNRDFVVQRSWLDTGKEYCILNHSVNHQAHPPKKGFIRGISYLTGYWITPTNGRLDAPGCQLTYVTQSDPKGKLPSWVVNKATQILAPKIMKKIHKACRGYDTWKSKHNPGFKPWLFPEQNVLPKLNMSDIRAMQESMSSDSLDESELKEEDLEEWKDDDV